MKKKIIAAVLGGTAVASLAFASASALSVDGGILQVGEDTSLACDTNGVKVDWALETDDDLVYFATVQDIADACLGADLVLQTNLMADNQKAVTTVTGNSERITFATPQPAADLESVKIWIGK